MEFGLKSPFERGFRAGIPCICGRLPAHMNDANYAPHRLSAPAVAAHLLMLVALLAIVAAHLYLSDVNFVAHRALVPVLMLPVAYFAGAFNVRGAVAAGLISGLSLIDDASEGRVLHTLVEVLQLGAICLCGALLGAVVTQEKHETAKLQRQETDRLSRQKSGPGYWDRVGVTRMGLYVTSAEARFIAAGLEGAPPGIVLDLGAGGGRLAAVLLERSASVVATEVDKDVITSLADVQRLQPLLVAAGVPSLPFADASLDWVVCVEVPSVSDEEWFRRECARVLKAGGSALVTVHNALSYKGIWARLLGRRRAVRGERWADAYYRHGLGWHRRRWREEGFEEEASIGLYWPPFTRESDSPLVTFFAALERLFGLGRLTWLSPWVLVRLRAGDVSRTHLG